PPIEIVVTIPRTLLTRINIINVKPSGKNARPVFQSIVSVTRPLTNSTTYSIKFRTPLGFICNFRLPQIQISNTTIDVVTVITTIDESTNNHDMPNRLSLIGH